MERDYQKDLEVCERATDSVWFHTVDNDNECCHIRDAFHNYIAEVASYDDAKFFALARTALPWYIKRCMEQEARLQQAEEREARYREALEKALGQWAMYADTERAFDGGYLDESVDPEDMEAMIYRQCKNALSSPSQSSRYRAMQVVIDKARDVVADHEEDLPNHPQVYCLAIALAALDQAREGAGQEEWQCPECGAWEEDERFCCTCQADKWNYDNVKTRTKEAPAHD